MVDLPQDIWWMVMQEMARRRDFVSLYNSALVSRDHGRLALPQLYSIHDLSPAMTSDTVVYDVKMPVVLWRSIISSSIGQTMFPYCLWIKALLLGNLHELLEGLAKDLTRKNMALFFSHPLEEFRIERETRVTRKFKGPIVDIEQIVIGVADRIAEFVKRSASEQGKIVTLTSLEGLHLPAANLVSWVLNLSQLTSLSIRDGSVLNAQVGQAIRDSCPAFKEVVCFFCKGTDVDQDLGGFFRSLAPNTLESFTVSSMNEISVHTFRALVGHAVSLRVLTLLSLERPALESLDVLSGCTSLEEVNLEANSIAQRIEWQVMAKQVFDNVVGWLQQCTSLRTLRLTKVPNATSLLGQVLKAPTVKLSLLSVKLLDSDAAFFSSLGHQTQLQTLLIDLWLDDPLDVQDPRHACLIDSICSCTELRELRLLNEPLDPDDVRRIARSLPRLEELTFEGEVEDDVLDALADGLPQLRLLNINALSLLTCGGLLAFVQRLALSGPSDDDGSHASNHAGLSIYVANQPDAALSEDEEVMLQGEVARLFGGRFEVGGRHEPGEMHESDFSD